MCRYTHPEGRGGFSNAEHARAFREAAYKHAGINMPAVGKFGLGQAAHKCCLILAVTRESTCHSDAYVFQSNRPMNPSPAAGTCIAACTLEQLCLSPVHQSVHQYAASIGLLVAVRHGLRTILYVSCQCSSQDNHDADCGGRGARGKCAGGDSGAARRGPSTGAACTTLLSHTW